MSSLKNHSLDICNLLPSNKVAILYVDLLEFIWAQAEAL